MNSFYSEEEVEKLGLKKIGKNVLISRNATFYGRENIIIGNNVRIDDFCILSGKIEVGNNIHISAGTMLFAGNAGIYLDDFTTISSRCVLYAITDDYSGKSMIGPMLSDDLRHVIEGPVILKKFAAIGAGCIVLPNVTLHKGAAVGAMSLVNRDLEEFSINYGIPARKIKERSRDLEKLEWRVDNHETN